MILTAGLLEAFDEEEARRAGCDAILRKPFEASVVMGTIGRWFRKRTGPGTVCRSAGVGPAFAGFRCARGSRCRRAAPDPERIQAAITLALDAALPAWCVKSPRRFWSPWDTERSTSALNHYARQHF